MYLETYTMAFAISLARNAWIEASVWR